VAQADTDSGRDRLRSWVRRSKPSLRGLYHWSCRTMAKAQGVSKATVNRDSGQSHQIKPHRAKDSSYRASPFLQQTHGCAWACTSIRQRRRWCSVLMKKSQISGPGSHATGVAAQKRRCGTMTHDYRSVTDHDALSPWKWPKEKSSASLAAIAISEFLRFLQASGCGVSHRNQITRGHWTITALTNIPVLHVAAQTAWSVSFRISSRTSSSWLNLVERVVFGELTANAYLPGHLRQRRRGLLRSEHHCGSLSWRHGTKDPRPLRVEAVRP